MNLCFASHHKTGTIYFKSVAKELKKRLNFTEIVTFRGEQLVNFESPPENTIVLCTHTDAKQIEALINCYQFKVIHSIRDPRTLIVSAMKYHLKSDEEWLHKPNPKLNNMTYQEYLNSIKDTNKRLIVEMNRSKKHINDMVNVYSAKEIHNVKIESLSYDTSCQTHFNMATSCGFSGLELLKSFNVFVRNSLFALNELPKHSTTGVKPFDTNTFSSEVNSEYIRLFGNAHKQLNY